MSKMEEDPDVQALIIDLFWSEFDDQYVARLRHRPGISAIGDSRGAALEMLGEVIADFEGDGVDFDRACVPVRYIYPEP